MSSRWVVASITIAALVLTAINIKSTSVFWGAMMPLVCVVLMFVTLLVFVSERVSGVQRPEVYIPTPEEIAAMKQRAERARRPGAVTPGARQLG